jgi:uncharacterized protein YdiU (UPF0061 family)
MFSWNHTYAVLPDHFYIRQHPVPVARPQLVVWNEHLATELGAATESCSEQDLAAIFSGNTVPEGADPLAMVYAGHQFGNFVPRLGDGRALLLGEIIDRKGQRWDLQLKGSGQTPFSRRGDGRAALGPMLREYLISEAMHALGIPTTRSLAIVSTGETVWRETPLAGAVLTRVASSHIRIGTFQYFAARGERDALEELAIYTLGRHFPEQPSTANPALSLLQQVIERQADLVAQWLHVGFIHGVMNTDNMTLSGETIDYGPCAFMDAYDPQTVFSAIDQHGRYAYANQPTIAQWNLARLAESLLPLLAPDAQQALAVAHEALSAFAPRFEAAWQRGMRRKLGFASEQASDAELIGDLLQILQRRQLDFANTFRALYTHLAAPEQPFSSLGDGEAAQSWLERWHTRLTQEDAPLVDRLETMRRANPAFIPRNHRVEQALEAAYAGDFGPFRTLHRVLATPYNDQPEYRDYAQPPAPTERVYQTFCGT